jgi:hypothetical protein
MLSEKRWRMSKLLSASLVFLALLCLSPVLSVAEGFVSTNVPLDHWSYDAVDKLIGQGLIDGSMLTTKPVSRFEMARHIAEADEKFQRLDSQNKLISDILERLKKEYRPELATIGTIDGEPIQDFAKPIERPYIKYVYARSRPDIENIRGDHFDRHSNLRGGFAARGQLFNIAAFYLHPEYPWSSEETGQDAKLIEAYGKLAAGKLEIEVGKDSLWWGPGYHGSLLMSNNAEPFKMVKLSTPAPVKLPWIFSGLGPFKFVWFLTQLEEDRPIPEPKLTGMRINFKPHPAVELGLSRAIIFGGEGRGGLGLRDYLDIFLATKENRPGKLDNDQLAGFDASVLLPVDWLMPAKTVKLYVDAIGEDEAGGLPSNFGKIFGAKVYDIFGKGKTDLTIEYANNHVPGKPNVFYSHHIYQAGYTYKDRIIGHQMGTDSKDLFLRLTHYLSSDVILGIQYDRQTSNLSFSPQPRLEQVQLDLTFFGLPLLPAPESRKQGNDAVGNDWEIQAGFRHENARGGGFIDNDILFLQVTFDF